MPTLNVNWPVKRVRNWTEDPSTTEYLQNASYYNGAGKLIQRAIPDNTPTAYFRSEDGQSNFTLPFAPNSYTLDGLASVYEVVQRSGKKPLLLYSRENLLSISMELFIAPKKQTYLINSVEEWISEFRSFVRQKKRWAFAYDGQVAGTWWRFTDASLTTNMRRPTDNKIAIASIAVTLTEATDVVVSVGPVSGGVAPTSPTPSGTPNRTHVLKSGDTFWGLASKYLGDGRRYPEIMKLNGITDPKSGRVGQVIKIPNA